MDSRLTELGYTTVEDFQRSWNLGRALEVDGIVGPNTSAALTTSVDALHHGEPTISRNFSAHEFACHCGGKLKGCAKTKILRITLLSLEWLRADLGGPITVIDGYRCLSHNASVGGAKDSQHLYGSAVDADFRIDKDDLVDDRLFSGIGYKAASGRVTHVDRRDVSGHNSTHGTLIHPTLWTYPGA